MFVHHHTSSLASSHPVVCGEQRRRLSLLWQAKDIVPHREKQNKQQHFSHQKCSFLTNVLKLTHNLHRLVLFMAVFLLIYDTICLPYSAAMLTCRLDQNSFNTTTSEATGGGQLPLRNSSLVIVQRTECYACLNLHALFSHDHPIHLLTNCCHSTFQLIAL